MISNNRVADAIFDGLPLAERKKVQAWIDRGHDTCSALLRSGAMNSGRETVSPREDLAESARLRVGTDIDLVRYRASIHEAGHGVCAKYLNKDVYFTEVSERGGGLTSVEPGTAEENAAVTAAGRVAQSLFGDNWTDGGKGCGDDDRKLARFTGGDSMNLERAISVAREILVEHADEVRELARRLVHAGRIDQPFRFDKILDD